MAKGAGDCAVLASGLWRALAACPHAVSFRAEDVRLLSELSAAAVECLHVAHVLDQRGGRDLRTCIIIRD